MSSIPSLSISQRDMVSLSPRPGNKTSGSFSDVMTDAMGTSKSQDISAKKDNTRILVGKISSEVSTVSELLSRNDTLGDSTWDIIYSEQNKNKDYTKIPTGTAIYFNPEDGALSWSGVESSPFPSSLARNISILTSASSIETTLAQHETASDNELITLGKVDANNPTVSHLLKNQPEIKEQMWQLLDSDINRDKAYDKIIAGTEIQLNPKTMELVWDDKVTVATGSNTISPAVNHIPVIPPTIATEPEHAPNNLSEAVQGYKGTPYNEINCYELLVKGLDNLNIAYSGKNGLYSKLTDMATEKGLAANAYLNGEGIVKAAGSKLFSQNYSNISDWQDKAETLMNEIEPLLGNGQILSFSTENRGHTGVIGRKDNQWTFINSGRMDNSVDKKTISMGVGEEVLHEEISNWFRSAHKKGESLTVTLGQLDQGKIRTASNLSQSYTNRI